MKSLSQNSNRSPSPSPSRHRSLAVDYSHSNLYEQRARGNFGNGDICASHRGNSPTSSPKPRRKISTSGYKVASPSASRKSPALSRKYGASRKSSERSRKNEEHESVLSLLGLEVEMKFRTRKILNDFILLDYRQ